MLISKKEKCCCHILLLNFLLKEIINSLVHFTSLSALHESNAYLGISFSKISVSLSVDQLLKEMCIRLYSSSFHRAAYFLLWASVMPFEEFRTFTMSQPSSAVQLGGNYSEMFTSVYKWRNLKGDSIYRCLFSPFWNSWLGMAATLGLTYPVAWAALGICASR